MAEITYQDTPVRVVVGGIPQTLDDTHLAGVIVEQVGVENLVGPQGPPGTAGANAVGRIAHGADTGIARPSAYALVIWIGSAEPANRAVGDLWIRTAA